MASVVLVSSSMFGIALSLNSCWLNLCYGVLVRLVDHIASPISS